MTATLLPALLLALPVRADEPPAPPAPPAPEPEVHIEGDIEIEDLRIEVDAGPKGQRGLRIAVDGQQLVIEGQQATGELRLGDLTIRGDGDRLRILDRDGDEGVITLGDGAKADED